MRVLVIISPFIGFAVAYVICKELAALATAGKRKVPNIVMRTATGRHRGGGARNADTVHEELEPLPVPTYVTSDEPVEVDSSGVRHVER